MNFDNYPILKANKIISVLKKMGFSVVKTKNSHKLLMHQDCRRTVVPTHHSRIISPILLNRILKDISVEMNEFIKYL
jgi:predicted RNA binding protein YcfA (HicA-like mRNA interferase family)